MHLCTGLEQCSLIRWPMVQNDSLGMLHVLSPILTWEGGTSIGVWNKEVPFIPAWVSFRTHYRPQTSVGSTEGETCQSPQASARIKRWSPFLSSYEYTLVFHNTKAHANADALSRLPLQVEPATTHTLPELILFAEYLDNSPVTANDIWRLQTCTSLTVHPSGMAKSLQCRLGAFLHKEGRVVCVWWMYTLGYLRVHSSARERYSTSRTTRLCEELWSRVVKGEYHSLLLPVSIFWL